ncbi:MAG: hypothetical protein LBB38_00465 [Puniceicoccales bacterium]|jgi:general secretion pathway protein D|nr:hypothetical protein [Puniceicoccales bacterium]
MSLRHHIVLLILPLAQLSASPIDDAIWGDSSLARAIYGDLAGEADNAKHSAGDGDVSRREVRERMLAAVDQSWIGEDRREEIAPVATAEDGEKPGGNRLEEKLRTISIEKICFREMPLRDAVDLLGEIAEAADPDGEGINLAIVDDPSDDCTVHMTLRNIPLGRAIELLAQCADFDWEIDGDTVILSSAEKNLERLRTKFFPLSRATVLRMTNLRQKKSDDERDGDGGGRIAMEERLIRNFLQNAGVDFYAADGASMAFDGSGIVVTQTPRNLKRVENILSRYADAKQVEIETKFIEVQQGVLDELQVRWSMAADHGKTKSASGGGNFDNLRLLSQAFSQQNGSTGAGSIVLESESIGGVERKIPIANQPPSMPSSANLGQNTTPLVDVMGVIGSTQLGFMLRALEQQTGSDLMSAPTVSVLSGNTAEIVVAQEFRYPEEYDAILSSVGTSGGTLTGSSAGVTITAGTPRNFKTRNIGVEMSVTPTVEADNRISLQLEPSVTEFEGFVEYGGPSIAVSGGSTVTIPSGFFQPIFSTRRIATEVTMDNGATVVMGGLTREEMKTVRDKIPILGDIPLLGRLFRSNGQSSQKRNLLIFVTARLSGGHGSDVVGCEIVRQPRHCGKDCPSDSSRKIFPELKQLQPKSAQPTATDKSSDRRKISHRGAENF